MTKINTSFLALFFTILIFSLGSCAKKKADLIAKDWKATKLNFGGSEIGGDIVSLEYSFKKDGSFSRTEDGKTEKGKWSLSEDGKKLTLNLDDKTKVDKDVKELTDSKLLLSGEEHGMMREETFEAKK
ncbi:MAG TPA: lipocalin family protein [Cytophagaceae bacterium]|jgi:hypothetical protein|nr:lipocalin family protein [Cytophagaceae bacterium]